MPAPPSYLDITALPFSDTITQAEFNGGTYGGTANTAWCRYVATDPTIVGVWCDQGGTFTPRIRVYRSDGTTLMKETLNTTGGFPASWYYLLDLSSPANEYYFEITRALGGASDFDFTVAFETAPLDVTPLPAGSIAINDDTTPPAAYPSNNFPAVVYQLDGTFVGFYTQVPAGEIADALPNSISLWQDRFNRLGGGAWSLALFDADLVYQSSVNTSPSLGIGNACLCNDGTYFYVCNRVTNNQVYRITDAGVVTGPICTLPGAVSTVSAIGISRDNTILYWAEGYDDPAIHRWDVINGVALSDLYTVPGLAGNGYVALTGLNEHPGEILVLTDDSVVTYVYNASTGFYSLLHISDAGTLLNQHDFSDATYALDHIHYSPDDDPDYVNIWLFNGTPGPSRADAARFGRMALATGTISPTFDTPLFSSGVNQDLNTFSDMFGPSSSCSMVRVGGGEPPPDEAEIIVIKVALGIVQSFSFVAGGGLDPAEFLLAHGESRTYSPVTPGSGYSIVEVPDAAFVTTYEVSNGDDPSNITVAAGETVTVTVTNVLFAAETETDPIRWLRRAPVMSDENIRLFHSQFTLDMQAGMGLVSGQGADPQVMMRYSDDSGQTWSEEHWRGSGKIGEYRRRVIWRRLGVSRTPRV